MPTKLYNGLRPNPADPGSNHVTTKPTSVLRMAAGLNIDADYFAGASTALLGKRGAGKTYTCRAIAEELHDAHVQTVIIDPMGVFWGLRSNADGKKGGLPIPVFGGEHGDAPLEHTAGQLMSDLVAEDGLSMVLDLSGFTSRTQERTFMREFADRLYRRNRTLVHVIVDEADLFAPQKPRREDAPLLVTMENLVRRGRNKGIGVTMASQRPATINKDVLTQVDVLVAMRVTAPQDRDAIRDWVRGQGTDEQWQEISPSLPSLANGEAWWWVPEKDILKKAQGRRTHTFDSSPTKKRGQEARAPKTFADVDLSAITERMQATIERAESKDPRVLTQRVRHLESELAKAQAAGGGSAAPAEVHEVPALSEEDRAMLRDSMESIASARQSAQEANDLLPSHIEGVNGYSEALSSLAKTLIGQVEVLAHHQTAVQSLAEHVVDTERGIDQAKAPPPKKKQAVEPSAPPSRRAAPTATPEAGAVEVPPARRRILDALADLAGIGVNSAPKNQVALWAGVSPKSSGYANNLGALRSLGLIDYPSPGRVALTGQGWQYVSPDSGQSPATTAALHDQVQALVPPARWRILAPLLDTYPRPVSREALAEAAGASSSSSGYANNLGALRSLGLIEYTQPGQIAASSLLFLEGSRA